MAQVQKTPNNVIVGERFDSTITLPITDSTTLTKEDFVELSSGKLIKSVTTLSSVLVGMAATNQTMGVLATAGQQEYVAVVTEGIVKVKGFVENSGGGTYVTAISVGTKVSFHYDSTLGQCVVNSTAQPIGIVVSGSVASAGASDDAWDYVLVQLDFEAEAIIGAGVANLAVTTAKLANGAVTGTKIAAGALTGTMFASGGLSSSIYYGDGSIESAKIKAANLTGTMFASGALSSSYYYGDSTVAAAKIVPGAVTGTVIAAGALQGTMFASGGISSTTYLADAIVPSAKTGVDVPKSLLNATIRYSIDGGGYTLNATLGTLTQTFSSTLATTAGAIILLQSSKAVTIKPYYGTLTVTSFIITGDNSDTGTWAAFVRV